MDSRRQEAARESPLAVMVLALLQEQPMHVYGLHKLMVERRQDEMVNIERRNSVQQVLTRLARDGYVAREDGASGRRIVFRTTAAGRDLLYEWLREEISDPAPDHPRFAAAVSLLGFLEPDEARRLLSVRRAGRAELVARLRAEQKEGSFLPAVLTLEVGLRIASAQAEIDWIDHVLGRIDSGELNWDPIQLLAQSPVQPPPE